MPAIRQVLAALCAATVLTLSACSDGTPGPEDHAVIIEETGTFLENWIDARKKGNGAALAPMYWKEAGFRWIEDGRVMYDDGADAAAALDFASTAGYTADLSISNLEITPAAKDAATVSGAYVQTLDLGGERIEGPGVFTATLVKRDGQWQFLQAHFSPAADFGAPIPAEEAEASPEALPN